MKKLIPGLALLFNILLAVSQNRDRQSERQGRDRKGGRRGGQARNNVRPTPVFVTEVPERDYDHILGRPTADSITLSLAAYRTGEFSLEYGLESGSYLVKRDIGPLVSGEVKDVDILSLRGNWRYYYRVQHRMPGDDSYHHSDEFTFHTQRPSGRSFRFTIQADSHLDSGVVPEKYERTLANALTDQPDFHIELGDTFMVDKYGDYRQSSKQYLAQRYYFSRLCHSVPQFFVLGNHDGEFGYRDTGGWSAGMRLKYFPNPIPNHFYTGNEDRHRTLGYLEDYYAWNWGDALFVVLDPFWYTTQRRGDQWSKTLGARQYHWLKKTLESSDASFKFIFIHYLVGGLNNETRGGKSIAHLYEWGGRNKDGQNEWNEKRPNWSMPIHDLLTQNNVSIVFHGHDHLYAKEDLDGIVYQEVPQPGHRRFGNTRNAEEYGYRDGVVLSSSGHLRVSVSSSKCQVEYIYSFLPEEERNGHRNGEIAHSYSIHAKDSKENH
ncbi:MAG TPA: metallophosphoesterase [Verrucomicrobiales bacterium]|nr:metallophosphoesterase [Verrucomicrobiales bacterium]